MAADGHSNTQQILEAVLDQGAQALKITGTVTAAPSPGAATSANQVLEIADLDAINSKTPTLGQAISANSSPVVIASDQTPIPVSGTITVGSSALPTNAAQESGGHLASIDTKTPALGQTTSSASQPVTIASDQSAVPISAASLPLPSGASTAANQTTGNNSLASIDGKIVTVNTGAVVISSSALPTGAATEATLSSLNGKVVAVNTGAVVISSSALPTGAATSVKQPALGTAGTASSDVITVQGIASMTPLLVNGSGSTQPVSGTVAATQSGTWTVQPGNTANTTPWLTTISQGGNSATVTGANALKVDSSAVTQPISAASLPLPTGAATSAAQTTAQTSLSSIDSKLTSPITVTGTIATTTATFTRAQAPTFTAGTSIAAAGGTRILVGTAAVNLRRLDVYDTTGLFINWYDAITTGTLIYTSGPGQDRAIDLAIASGTTLYIESADANSGLGGSLAVNFLA